MAVGPQMLRERAAQYAASAERLIDSLIRESSDANVTISTREIEGLTLEIWRNVLRPKYLAAGWTKAEWVSDQRDGDYLDFQ